MSLLLFFGFSPQTNVSLTFMDESGINPLPAGQLVTLTRPGTATQSAYSGIGGTINGITLNDSSIDPPPVYAKAAATGNTPATISWPSTPPKGAIAIFAVTTGGSGFTRPAGLTRIDQAYDTTNQYYLTTFYWVADGATNSFTFQDPSGANAIAAYATGWGPVNGSNIDVHSMSVSASSKQFNSPSVNPASSYGMALSFFSFPSAAGAFTEDGAYTAGTSVTGSGTTVLSNYEFVPQSNPTFDSGTVPTAQGYIATTIVVAPLANAYTATFYGTWSPPVSVQIYNTGTSQTVNIPTYQSPTYSQTGFTQSQAGRWVRAAFGNTARQLGGTAYNLAYGLSYGLHNMSTQIQQVFQSLRLPTSVGASIDSWVKDFFGNNLPRAASESDAAYISRVETNLQAKGSLRSGVVAVAETWGTTTVNEGWLGSVTGGTDSPTCATDGVYGCVGGMDPCVGVYITPTTAFTSTTQALARNSILNKKAAGINLTPYQISTQYEGYGIGRYGQSKYGVAAETIATPL